MSGPADTTTDQTEQQPTPTVPAPRKAPSSSPEASRRRKLARNRW